MYVLLWQFPFTSTAIKHTGTLTCYITVLKAAYFSNYKITFLHLFLSSTFNVSHKWPKDQTSLICLRSNTSLLCVNSAIAVGLVNLWCLFIHVSLPVHPFANIRCCRTHEESWCNQALFTSTSWAWIIFLLPEKNMKKVLKKQHGIFVNCVIHL